MKSLIIVLIVSGLSNPLFAQSFESSSEQTVIELFTSEGCSSCPPAEHWLSELTDDPRLFDTLFPLAFHVDYWNQLGWYDRFSSSVYSMRERVYKSQGAIRQVYTPGMLVNGKEWRGWIRNRALPVETIDSGRLRVEIEGRKLRAEYSGLMDQKLVLNIAYLGMGLSSQVKSGENSGRLLKHDFVVLNYENHLGQERWNLVLSEPGDFGQSQTALVVWLSTLDRIKPLHVVGGLLN